MRSVRLWQSLPPLIHCVDTQPPTLSTLYIRPFTNQPISLIDKALNEEMKVFASSNRRMIQLINDEYDDCTAKGLLQSELKKAGMTLF